MPVADLRSTSTSVPASHDYDPQQETQLLYGETIKIISDHNDWLKIEAVEQPEFSHNNVWQGYPGWIQKSAVIAVKKLPDPNFVVSKKSARLCSKPNTSSPFVSLSLGTKLVILKTQKNGFWKVRTPADKTAWILKEDVRLLTRLPEEFSRKLIVDSARTLLGDLYFWGGRSAHMPELKNQVTAVDCSGLVNLAYRTAGIDVPRDSYEQFLKAKKIRKQDLKLGDLIFSGTKDKPGKVTHAAIFWDVQTILEAPQTGEKVRIIEFEKKYGLPLEKIKENEPVGERLLYFGSYF